MKKKFAPIIVFTYLRFTKLRTLVNKLKKIKSQKCQIFIFLVIIQNMLKIKKKYLK